MFEEPRLNLDALPAKKVVKFTSTRKPQEKWTHLFGAYTIALCMEDTVADDVIPNLIKVAKTTLEKKSALLATPRKSPKPSPSMRAATPGLVEQRLPLLLKKALEAAPVVAGEAPQGIRDSIVHLLRIILGVWNELNSFCDQLGQDLTSLQLAHSQMQSALGTLVDLAGESFPSV